MLLNKPTCHVPNSDCLTASSHTTLSIATLINFICKIIKPYISAKSYKRQSVVSNVAIHEQILTGVTHMYPGVPPFETWTEDKLYGFHRAVFPLSPSKEGRRHLHTHANHLAPHSQIHFLVPSTIHTVQCFNVAIIHLSIHPGFF